MISVPISTRHAFFTGKGGVGKTALACAVAISLADSGQRVLLISTDPASNLDEMLGVRLSTEPTPVSEVPGLFALNVDPEAAAEAYRERVLAPYRPLKSEDELRALNEQLAGACTVEIAAFDHFTRLLVEDGTAGQFDRVLFDTAPTGHTLRLLQLPRAWTRFLETSDYSASCLGPHTALETEYERFAAAMRVLGDREKTTIMLVARPDVASLREAERTAHELEVLGIRNHQLVVNAVFRATDARDPVAMALERRGREALETMPAALRGLPTTFVPLRGFNMVGIPALRALLKDDDAPERPGPAIAVHELPSGLGRLSDLVDELAASTHGLVMVTGKGGVGKTTIAAGLAVELASRGIPTHLSTTDPAAHVAATVVDSVEQLAISRIDPAAETRAYTTRVLDRKGQGLDAAGRALLEEDLRSPCTEEVAVFHAFSRIVMQASAQFVVLDTAPTGHTLLLLDTTGAYHRELTRAFDSSVGRAVTPLMRLQDPRYTKVLIVTLAETTPVTEAGRLQTDLRRAGVEPFAWVINSSLAATATRDPLLRQRISREIEQIERVQRDFARRVIIVPWMPVEPVGPERLRALVRGEVSLGVPEPDPAGAPVRGKRT